MYSRNKYFRMNPQICWKDLLNKRQRWTLFRCFHYHTHLNQIQRSQRISSSILSGSHLVAFRITFALSNTLCLLVGLRCLSGSSSTATAVNQSLIESQLANVNERFMPMDDGVEDNMDVAHKNCSETKLHIPRPQSRKLWMKLRKESSIPFQMQSAYLSIPSQIEAMSVPIVIQARSSLPNLKGVFDLEQLIEKSNDAPVLHKKFTSSHIPRELFTNQVFQFLLEKKELLQNDPKLLAAVVKTSIDIVKSDVTRQDILLSLLKQFVWIGKSSRDVDQTVQQYLQQIAMEHHRSLFDMAVRDSDTQTLTYILKQTVSANSMRAVEFLGISSSSDGTECQLHALLQRTASNIPKVCSALVLHLINTRNIPGLLDFLRHVVLVADKPENRLIVTCIRFILQSRSEQHLDSLVSVLQPYPHSLRVLYSLWISRALKSGGPVDVQKVVQKFQDIGFEPDAVNYNDMMNCYLRMSQYKEVLELYQKMIDSDIRPTLSTFTLLLQMPRSFLSENQIQHILNEIRRFNLRPDSKFITTLVSKSISAGNDKFVHKVIKDVFNDASFTPDFMLLQRIFSWGMRTRNAKIVQGLIVHRSGLGWKATRV